MSLFDINFNIKAIEWLPPDKRQPTMVNWVQSLLSGVQYSQQRLMVQYRTGSNFQQFNPLVSSLIGYRQNAIVTYKGILYQSLVAGNIDYPPSVNWQVYLPSFIGVDNRILFNGQKLVLEYALNEYFNTVKVPCNFRQPPLQPDIYIGSNAFEIVGFIVGNSEVNTSTISGETFTVKSGTVCSIDTGDHDIPDWIPGTYSWQSLVIYEGYLFLCTNSSGTAQEPPDTDWLQVQTIGFITPFLPGDNFTIYVPNLVYNNTQFPNFESDCRQFVNKIIPAGLVYNIIPY